MLRFRRYRVFLIFAALATLIFVRLTYSRDWAQHGHAEIFGAPPTQSDDGHSPGKTTQDGSNSQQNAPVDATNKHEAESLPPLVPSNDPDPVILIDALPHVVLPDRKPVSPTKVTMDDDASSDIHAGSPSGRKELDVSDPDPVAIHWVKQLEHFPLPAESLIPLPTGSPVKIARIQHSFGDETPDAKTTREKRQETVKEEFKRAFAGYKKNAWMHDELSPVSGSSRDPFCGWAATLVDALDTLWIMGLEEEFVEAAKAVESIDFTTTPRADIPLFETTIRYLGGLLAAYDVSGAVYPNLLKKAVELGNILIGAFDTPNRMPVLYYHWKPTFSSQAHRAGQRSNLAELGSLSMEFTRLSQLTHDPRYYDAIARITNALSDWQERGTRLDGIFPDEVDASGCNRTASSLKAKPRVSGNVPAISPAVNAEEPLGYKPDVPEPVKEPRKARTKNNNGPGTLELQVLAGEPSKAHIEGWEEVGGKRAKRDEVAETVQSNETTVTQPNPPIDTVTGLPLDIPAAKAKVGSKVGEWDCAPQGLVPSSSYGREKYSMAGGQDSTYEYFPKQYLLLGGLEETYRKLYLKTVNAIQKHLLYRPMTPDSRDILFSGSVSFSRTGAEPKFSADVEHLACFIGGMVGMGAKVFGRDGDLEIAIKLTDGCVWAYESTVTGIMPEGAIVMPCENSENCPWNETAYYEFLDPMGKERDKNVQTYIENKAAREAQEEEDRRAAAIRAEAEKINTPISTDNTGSNSEPSHEPNQEPTHEPEHEIPDHELDALPSFGGSDSLKRDKPVSLQKREEPRQEASPSQTPNAETPLHHKAQLTEQELASIASDGRKGGAVPRPSSTQPLKDPYRPLNHKEYVEARIKQESLPKGFVNINSKRYILRPEAIESVWYMYRITGDPSWQEKGWKMFEAIMKATTTDYGNSAISDVTSEAPYILDEMESFWMAETLKYFYLLFSPPDTINLDEWVLNTEAHPFKRPTS